ncbi:MAG TPA: DUF2177 family protein [Candidatus Dojkabacteria bacterium]|nr:DUF2177 family protein [Candidatus Dojkabacteria bacterium]HOR05877.1 DUF2177 family protein [Candidatus Dojkabacteria bacterium]
MKYIYLYIITFVVFLAIDFIWLNFIAKNIYATKIGHLLAENPKLFPALIFYLVFIVGVIIFAVLPGYEAQNIWKTVMLGALFGFLTYSTYDLTNLATLKNWPVSVTIIDLIWGTSISTVTSVAGYYIAMALKL